MKRLTKNQFRLLLAIYCVIVALEVLFWPHRSLTRERIAETKRNFGMEGLTDYQFVSFMAVMMATVLAACFGGLLFLFFFLREGLYIFLGATLARLVVFWIQYGRFPIHHFLTWTEFILELTIVGVGLFGPASHLFQRPSETEADP